MTRVDLSGTRTRTGGLRGGVLPFLRVGIVLALALLGAADPALAQDRDAYRPWFDEVLSGRADRVVVGRLGRSVRLPNGENVDRFEVKETLAGPPASHLLFAAAPAALRDHADLPKLVFVAGAADVPVATALDVIDLPPADGRDRVALVKTLLEAAGRTRPRERARAVKAAVMSGLDGPSPWCRRVLVRELERLGEVRPADFDGEDVLALEAFVSAGLPEDEVRRLRRARARLAEAAAVHWTAERLLFESEEQRAAFLRDLATFQRGGGDVDDRRRFLDAALRTFRTRAAPVAIRALDDHDPEIREHAARRLGDLFADAATPALTRIALDRDEPLALRREALASLAMIAPLDGDVALRGLARDEDVRRDALRTIAAVSTGEARDFLQALRRENAAAAEPDPALESWLAHLASDAFAKELDGERRRRRETLAPRSEAPVESPGPR